ncbi:uncharacterized protein LOC126907194 [Daktulosphaira vitifoliae]|uniref:uncharacterized protein LOC126907194 n=1 Tax=Daktulosphaira vitifoliae TaxID=58002 RepID=UPI0021AAB0DC|nr:uncharacterized protein LOC126907194 [Daktulosphaira vitifoliae]
MRNKPINTVTLLLFALVIIGKALCVDLQPEEQVRIRRRHLDLATKTRDSNEIDELHRNGQMSLTNTERLKYTASSCIGNCATAIDNDVLQNVNDDSMDRTIVLGPSLDEHTSQSQYFYEYVGPTRSSGEAKRASSRGRSLVPTTEPTNTAQHPQQMGVVGTEKSRKAESSEMEDTLDEFVKHWTGQNEPMRKPLKSRINNRGPPRISDAPIVMDLPAFLPMPQQSISNNFNNKQKDPPPYPFDIPQQQQQPSRPLPPQPPSLVKPFLTGVPLPNQLVPTENISLLDNQMGLQPPPPPLPSRRPQTPSSFQTPPKPQQDYNLVTQQNIQMTTSSSEPEKITIFDKVTLPTVDKDKPKPTTTDNPQLDINATKVIGLQVSKIVNHLQNQQPSSIGISDSVEKFTTAIIPITETTSTKPLVSSTNPTISSTEPVNGLDSITGVGSAVVVLEPSTSEVPHREDLHKPTDNKLPAKPTAPVKKTSQSQQSEGFPYYSRPGIVLDDPEFKPHLGGQRRPIQVQVPTKGDVFDIMVSAIQGPGDKTGPILTDEISPSGVGKGEVSVITSAEPNQQFVSIDGKRTYINLFGQPEPTAAVGIPPPIKPTSTAAGSFSVSQVLQQPNSQVGNSAPSSGNAKTPVPAWKRPTHPPVRIDTCIVGDDSTCDAAQHERCRTEFGVSSCLCRPGYSRRKHRDPCHRIVSIVFSLRVDRMYDTRISWIDKYKDQESQEYQQLEHEAARAIDSAFSMTPFSDTFVGVKINNIYMSKTTPGTPVMVNATVQLTENAEHLRSSVKQDVQKQLTGALQRRNNNVGTSGLWVDSPAGAIAQLHDLDECTSTELNDCHPLGKCTNVFGTFQCTCPEGYRDPWVGNAQRSGRTCETCDPAQCNLRGECFFQAGQPVCKCSGSFYGAQCEIDGEVLSVAVGSSVAAISIIVLTLVCLCAWSRRWNKEQKVGSPVFGYMPTGGSTVKTPVIGGPPYQVSIEDRMRWAQIADAMAHANHYAPEPGNGTMRSNMFGYAGAPMPLPRLRPPGNSTLSHPFRTPESSTSEEEDRTDLLGRNYQTSRPKSRSSLANQSGIYYDVDYEQQQQQQTDLFSGGCIPLNTYTIGSRSNYYRA